MVDHALPVCVWLKRDLRVAGCVIGRDDPQQWLPFRSGDPPATISSDTENPPS